MGSFRIVPIRSFLYCMGAYVVTEQHTRASISQPPNYSRDRVKVQSSPFECDKTAVSYV
ncbi:hypothetical protein AB6A40_010513, partial [Gnathostoma spinigerum]